MSCGNYRRNKAEIDRFRKELMEMVGDIKEIDRKVMNKSVNKGMAYARKLTPVGEHPNPVTFAVHTGNHAGKVVSFKVSNPGVGGFLRKSWHKLPTQKTPEGVECEIINTADYAAYWNYGHRIVNRKGGPTKGFVKGTYVLEKTVSYTGHQMGKEFLKEMEAVKKKYDD